MKLIDFDARFAEYLTDWVRENEKKFKTPEDMEDAMPEVYVQFLEKPADWLEGATPGAYFDSVSDAAKLCGLLCDYAKAEIPVPDPLLSRLEELAEEEALLQLVLDTDAPCEARMHGIALLRQMESTAPMTDYLRWQVTRCEEDDLLDNALESLRDMGEAVHKPAKIAFSAADASGKEALLDVLCDFPADDDVFAFTLHCFQTQKARRGLFAGYLAKLDDDRALEPLLDVAEQGDVDYVDFIEIRSAIERLGSEAPIRDFTNDPTYAAVQRLQ